MTQRELRDREDCIGRKDIFGKAIHDCQTVDEVNETLIQICSICQNHWEDSYDQVIYGQGDGCEELVEGDHEIEIPCIYKVCAERRIAEIKANGKEN